MHGKCRCTRQRLTEHQSSLYVKFRTDSVFMVQGTKQANISLDRMRLAHGNKVTGLWSRQVKNRRGVQVFVYFSSYLPKESWTSKCQRSSISTLDWHGQRPLQCVYKFTTTYTGSGFSDTDIQARSWRIDRVERCHGERIMTWNVVHRLPLSCAVS